MKQPCKQIAYASIKITWRIPNDLLKKIIYEKSIIHR